MFHRQDLCERKANQTMHYSMMVSTQAHYLEALLARWKSSNKLSGLIEDLNAGTWREAFGENASFKADS
jgi:hypothetical protein